ncbi:MAG: glycosyltransferase [Ekhidna sp.]
MNILHIGKYYPPYFGGIENFMADLLPYQVRLGHSVSCIVHNHKNCSLTSEETRERVSIIRVGTILKFLFTPISPSFGLHLSRLIESSKPDLIHVHMPNVSAYWLLLLNNCDHVPLVIHWHSDVDFPKSNWLLNLAYGVYRPLEQALLEKCHSIVVTSKPYLDSSKPLEGWKDKAVTIPLGIEAETENISVLRENISWHKSARIRLLCVGRLSYYKGHQVLLRAMALTANASLIIVGEGKMRKVLEQQIRNLNIGNSVKISGTIPPSDLKILYSKCDCLVLPSTERTEAFGVVLLEAMRSAKPAIASDVPGSGMSFVVKDGVTGLIFKNNNSQDLARAIVELQNDSALLHRMGAAAFARFKDHFTITNVAKKIDLVYENLV